MRWILAIILGLVLPAAGEERRFEKIEAGGMVYRDVRVMKQTETDLFISHAEGLGNLKLKNLSPELQKELGYDPQKAAAAEQKLREARERAKKASTLKPLAEKELFARSFIGKKAPLLQVEKWLTEAPELEGKFLLLEFWGSWCPASRRTITLLNGLHEKFGDQMVMVGLSDESEQVVRNADVEEIEYYSAIDQTRRTLQEYQVTAIPHIVIIDPEGVVQWEGFPWLKGFELTENTVSEILKDRTR